jgi:hypothetical protein
MNHRALNRTIKLLERTAFDAQLAHDAAVAADLDEATKAQIRRARAEAKDAAVKVRQLIERFAKVEVAGF